MPSDTHLHQRRIGQARPLDRMHGRDSRRWMRNVC
jgi:hypothetical protein